MKRVAIIGAGLAGTSLAYVLKERGLEPVIYEAGSEIAPGASGNARGLYNPRLSAEKTFHAEAFQLALKMFPVMKNIGWERCGSLHLATDEKKEKRFQECARNWGWEDMRFVDAGEASAIAGVEIGYKALWLPQSGVVSPKKLCEAYAEGIEIHFNKTIPALSDIKADAVVLANGMGAKNFAETKDLPLKAVRGQITFIAANEKSKKVQCNLCYGGYLTPGIDDVHAVGSTFQRWLDHEQIIESDDADNIKKLGDAIPALAEDYKVMGHRSAVRTTTDAHVPITGPVAGHRGLYVSTAHGSHGILTSLWAAYRIADDILKGA